MNQKYTEGKKSFITTPYINGESVANLIVDTGIPRSTI